MKGAENKKGIKRKMTNVKAREEIILELGNEILNAVRGISEKQTEPLSLVEVIIACGNAQIALYERGYAKEIAQIEIYEKEGVWHAAETSIGVVREGKAKEEALTALENALLSFPPCTLTEAQTKAIPYALAAIKEAKEEER